MRRRVWCETLTLNEVTAPPVLALLVRYRLELLLAVRPWQLAELPAALHELRGHGVPVAAWPMLADQDGRWASVTTSAAFVALVDAVVNACPELDELVLDLEPPLSTLRAWQRGRRAPRLPGAPIATYAGAERALVAAIQRWAVGGTRRRITTALMPPVLLDGPRALIQRALGTPALALPVDGHSVMAYTSMLEGWSHGLVDRRRAEGLLALCARSARRRLGDRAGLSLGAVGPGAFGDEPAYRAPGELARDVAIARSAGIDDLSLFELGGTLRRGDPDAWLAAFVAD